MATDQNNSGSIPGDDPFSDWAEALEEQKQTDAPAIRWTPSRVAHCRASLLMHRALWAPKCR